MTHLSEDDELTEECLVDHYFVNRPTQVIREWFEKVLIFNNETQTEIAPLLHLILSAIFIPLAHLWSLVEPLKMIYRGTVMYQDTNEVSQIREFRFNGDSMKFLYKYQRCRELWDPSCLYLDTQFEDALRFLLKVLKYHRRDFKAELLEVVWNGWWSMTLIGISN